MAVRLKNKSDDLIFQSAICAEASQICPYRRAEFDILLALLSVNASEWMIRLIITMRQELLTLVFAAAALLLLIWRIKGGYACGMMQEIVNLLSGVIALAGVALVFLAVTSAISKSTHILAVCMIALVLLGILFKLCRLIFAPLLAVGNIFIVNGINKLMGAVMGAAEACLLAYFSYKALAHFGIYVL